MNNDSTRREYYLSRCFCPCPVRVRTAGQKPDRCAECGGWLPDYPVTDAEWCKERNHQLIAYLVWSILAIGAAILAALLSR